MTATTSPPPPPRIGVHDPLTSPSFWRRRGIRTAWIVLGTVFTVAALAWGTLESVARIAHDETTEQQSWAAADITTVEIRNSAGDVEVVGADTDTIELTSHISRGLFETGHEERIDGDRLILTVECPWIVNHFCQVDQELVVPDHLSVEVVSYDGDTDVADISGPVRVFSEDGRVDLARLSGPLDLDLRHGSAEGTQISSAEATTSSEFGRVRLSFVESPDLVIVDAQFGDVEILVPDDGTFYAVTSRTDFGDTDNLLRSDPAADARIDVRAEFGSVRLGYAS
jgi:hypothetical protein